MVGRVWAKGDWGVDDVPTRRGPGHTNRGLLAAYAVVLEWAGDNYSAYVADLPGCISAGRTVEEAAQNIREAIELHLEGMIEDGEPVPLPQTVAVLVPLVPQWTDAAQTIRTAAPLMLEAGKDSAQTGADERGPGDHDLGPGALASVAHVAGWRDGEEH